jgi:hypothetical protein
MEIEGDVLGKSSPFQKAKVRTRELVALVHSAMNA